MVCAKLAETDRGGEHGLGAGAAPQLAILAALKRTLSPVMGASILLAMLVLTLRLRAGRLAPSPR
jgi:hypothetical protein